MYMAEKMDSGDIIKSKKIPILITDTKTILYDKLAHIEADLLLEVMEDFIKGKIKVIHKMNH